MLRIRKATAKHFLYDKICAFCIPRLLKTKWEKI